MNPDNDDIMPQMATYGFNCLFPCFLWAGAISWVPGRQRTSGMKG